ncbi:hypothetical protein [Cupriavidus basilensis]|uniref:hypothetical protein n=1 Tax=Cupriavidus basilensis TaxID=68895 RepID=UPI0023E8ACD0|nr:hypothetical protein [Cupriavidus basilensis]MDF3885919.1 hypothetical protein [Cupriavidus basilensis]
MADRITELPANQIRKGTYPVDARLPIEKFMTEQYGAIRLERYGGARGHVRRHPGARP